MVWSRNTAQPKWQQQNIHNKLMVCTVVLVFRASASARHPSAPMLFAKWKKGWHRDTKTKSTHGMEPKQRTAKMTSTKTYCLGWFGFVFLSFLLFRWIFLFFSCFLLRFIGTCSVFFIILLANDIPSDLIDMINAMLASRKSLPIEVVPSSSSGIFSLFFSDCFDYVTCSIIFSWLLFFGFILFHVFYFCCCLVFDFTFTCSFVFCNFFSFCIFILCVFKFQTDLLLNIWTGLIYFFFCLVISDYEPKKILVVCECCQEKFTDPRWLGCLHTFCAKDIEDAFELARQRNEPPRCPTCKEGWYIFF